MEIKQFTSQRENYLKWLLLADEQIELVEQYMN